MNTLEQYLGCEIDTSDDLASVTVDGLTQKDDDETPEDTPSLEDRGITLGSYAS